MSSALANRSDADQYLAQRIAVRDGVDVETLAALPAHELDRLLPGGRATFQHRAEVASGLLARRGIDPTSPAYQAADQAARDILARVDRLGSDHAA
ncbi:hypothetical protein [Amycolatopsis sp. cmx-4-54]|uniref:hypothetical protein n=1 Tax=Amycolatopsis sp. cmx-4-54 TaxID=2790936 RepID=UPI00397BA461